MDFEWTSRDVAERVLAETMTASMVAERLGVSRMTVNRWIRAGELPTLRNAAGTALVWEGDLQAFEARRNMKPFEMGDIKPMEAADIERLQVVTVGLDGLPPGSDFRVS